MSSPTLCPVCSCPIQCLCDFPTGLPVGTIADAVRKHAEVVHPDQVPE